MYNPRIKPDIIYRSALLTLDNPIDVLHFIEKKGIETIIDLRAEREVLENPYDSSIKDKINYVNIHFDPWDQPPEFQKENTYGTNVEMAYRFYVKQCQAQFKQFFELLAAENTGKILFHCFSGKDRVGILATAIHLLTEAPMNIVYEDYLASKKDTTKELIGIFLDEVEAKGGIRPYLRACGVSCFSFCW